RMATRATIAPTSNNGTCRGPRRPVGCPWGSNCSAGMRATRPRWPVPLAEVVYQSRAEREEEPIYVAGSAICGKGTMTERDWKNVWWVGRLPEPSTQAKALVIEEPATWQGTEGLHWSEREVRLGERVERWIVAQTRRGGGAAARHAQASSG